MPLYAYKCPSCGAERDVLHPMAETDPAQRSAETTAETTCTEHPEPVAMVRDWSATAVASIGTFASATPQQRKDMLLKRSRDHFQTHIKEQKHELTKQVQRNGRI